MDSFEDIIKDKIFDITFAPKRSKGKNFTQISNILIDNSDLTIYEKMIFIVIKRHMINKLVCWPSIPTIARKAGCGETTAKKRIKSLIKKKYIEKVEIKTVKSNVYRILKES